MSWQRKGLVSDSVSYASLDSPLGAVWLAATPRGLARVSFGTDEVEFTFELEHTYKTAPTWDPDGLEPMIRQLNEYFAGDRMVFDLPIDLSRASEFQRAVLETVRQVPYGEVQSYGDIAFAVGKPLAARAVGGVMATNPVSIVIPCHRIVRSDGSHGEYALRTLGASGATMKELLLNLEGRGIEARSTPSDR
jgi:methylated-DNA-[protein]-cysteine S-methyltransferase